MKISLYTVTFISLLLGGCTTSPNSDISLEQRLENPLYAERYAEEMVDRIVEYKIQKDPITEDKKKVAILENARKKWLEVGRDARNKQREGFSGFLITINEPVQGELLYVNNLLYTDTTFTIAPGPDLHLYLSQVVDPRDAEFPDETAIDIGKIQSAYGAHIYTVPPVEDPQPYRTIAVWDNKLEILHGFAQLSK